MDLGGTSIWSVDMLIGGEPVASSNRFDVKDKYSGAIVARVAAADRAHVDRAVDVAAQTMHRGELEPHRRNEILQKAADGLARRRDEIVDIMVSETGFTTSDCLGDVNRTLETLRISGEEAKRIAGEVVPLDGAAGQSGRIGITIRVPVGVVAAITPFNSPLNTVAHKVAPALAAGNAVVLKPAEQAPLSAMKLAEALTESGLPPGWLNIVHGDGMVGGYLTDNQRVRYYTFTGSTEVGAVIQKAAGLRRTQMELGNISGTIVCEDASFAIAIPRCTSTAFRKAGEVCTSLQRIFVQRKIYREFLAAFVEAAAALKVGDPRAKGTDIGPMIAESEAIRAETWVNEARSAGATVLVGGRREGALFWPTILTDVTREMKVLSSEIFAPVVCVLPYDRFEDAIDAINDTPYGLAAGMFTSDLSRALLAARKIDTGSFHVNHTSSCRQDLMPYGGMKNSGFGREGPRYAIRDMTEEKLVTFTPV